MATLAFTVQANYDKLIALRAEITKLETQLKNLGANATPQSVDNLQKQLASTKSEFTQVANGAAIAGNEVQNNFKKKILDASQSVFDLKEKMIAQKKVIQEVKDDVKRLSEEYRSLNKYSKAAEDKLTELNAAKKALEEERGVMFGLSQEQAKATLNVQRLTAEYKALGKGTKEADNVLDELKDKLLKVSAVFTAGMGIKNFVGQMVQVRSQFQAADTAIETMLGNKEKADNLMAKVREYAKISPLEFSDVTSATQMMLGFNIEAEKVPKFLSAIGDVSMGNSQKFNSLTLAFSQMSAAGKLMGQDLNQMINAGFNPLQAMSAKTGKSIAQLKEEMSKGAISAEMVQQAFIDATSEGGKFYKMSEKGAQAIQGQMSMMKDALDAMFNELGTKSEGTIMKAYAGVTTLIENYETVGKVLAGLIATYGVYKAAVILNIALTRSWAVATKADAVAKGMQTLATAATTKATLALNAALSVNPFAAFAAVVLGTVAAMWAFKDSISAVSKEQKQMDKAMGEAEVQADREQRKLAELKGKLDGAKKGTKEYNEAKQEIINNYSQYDSTLSAEIEKVGLTETAYNKLRESILGSVRARAYQKEMDAIMSSAADDQSEKYTKLYQGMISQYGEKEGAQKYQILRRGMQDNKTSAEYKASSGGRYVAGKYVMDEDKYTVKMNNKEARDIMNGLKGNLSGYVWDIVNSSQTTKKLGDETRQKYGITDEQLKKVQEDKKEPTTPQNTSTNTAKGDADKLKKEADARAKKQKEYTESVKLQLEQSALEIETKQLELDEDGFGKRSKEIDLNYRKLQHENKKREERMLAALADNMLSEYIDKNPNSSEKERTAYRNSLTDANNPNHLTRDSLRNGDELMQKQAAQLDSFDSIAEETRINNTKQLYEQLFKEYQTYTDRREEAEKKFVDDVAVINASDRTEEQKTAAIAEAEKVRKESIDRINNEETEATMKTSDAMVKLFGDASEKSTKELQEIIDKTEQMLNYIENTKPSDYDKDTVIGFGFTPESLKVLAESPEKLKAIRDQLNNLKKEATKANPFKALSKALHDVFDKDGKNKKSDTETKLKLVGKAAAETADYIGEIAGNLSKMFEEVGNTDMADSMTAVEETMGAVSNIGKGFAEGGLIGGIAAAAGEAMNLVGKAFAASAEHAAALKAIMAEVTAQQNAYTLAILDSKLAAEDLITIFGTDKWGQAVRSVDVAKESYELLGKAIRGTADDQKQVIDNAKKYVSITRGKMFAAWSDFSNVDTSNAGLRKIEVKTGHKKGGLFSRGKDLYSSILDVYPQLIKADGEFDAQLAKTIMDAREMSDESKAALQSIINLYEEQEKALEQMRDYLSDIFGSLGSDMTTALVDAFRNGTDAARAFTKSVTSMLEKMAEDMAYSVTLAPLLQKAQADMEAVTKDESLNEKKKFERYTTIISNLTSDTIAQQERFNNLLESAREQARNEGYELWSNTSEQEASNKVTSSITQDQASEISGRLTATQEGVYAGNEIAQQKLTLMTDIRADITTLVASNSSIRDIADDTRDIIAQSYLELQGIRENTEAVVKPIKDMASAIADFKSNGVKIK